MVRSAVIGSGGGPEAPAGWHRLSRKPILCPRTHRLWVMHRLRTCDVWQCHEDAQTRLGYRCRSCISSCQPPYVLDAATVWVVVRTGCRGEHSRAVSVVTCGNVRECGSAAQADGRNRSASGLRGAGICARRRVSRTRTRASAPASSCRRVLPNRSCRSSARVGSALNSIGSAGGCQSPQATMARSKSSARRHPANLGRAGMGVRMGRARPGSGVDSSQTTRSNG